MGERPTLEAKLADLANRLRFLGISLIVIALLAIFFSPRGPAWPFEPLAFTFAVILAVGCTTLVCGQMVLRRVIGFGSMEPPPVTIPKLKD